MVELYRINKPACQGCRVNNKDSPNCFCALIPPPGGFRKTGNIWQKASDIEARIGSDPRELLRPNLDSPSGLTNLGATCYVNSVLQCLFRIKPFIQGFLDALPELLDDQPVLQKLALLFGELRFGKKKAVDSAPLANVLELNNSIQQDGQEFLKLLLSSLESLLGKARKVIRDVFRGTVSHVTRYG
jgi:ubiquitin carboxyl-terminal hydrolase 48